MRLKALLVLMLCSNGLLAEELLRLPIGDPARREKTVSVMLDAITDSSSGESLSPRELAQRLKDVRIVFMGESHTAVEFHKAQLQLVRELHKTGRQVLLGLEMFPAGEQKKLDDWNQGLLTEKGFVELADWYSNWGYNWNYYRDIFLFARDQGIRLFAVNVPRSVVTAVRQKGFDELSDEDKTYLPERIDTDNEDHRRLFKAFMTGGDENFHAALSEEQFNGMFNAQCTWDGAMAHNAVRNLRQSGEADSIMVVLIGMGHVAYGLGIQRQASLWFDDKMASVVPVAVMDEDGARVESAQASFANYIWGVPQESFPAFPELGVSTRKDEDSGSLKVLFVQPDSVAAKAGLESGDILLQMDGVSLTARAVLNRLVSEKTWGEKSTLRLRRGEEEIELPIRFQRTLEDEKPEQEAQTHHP